MQPPPPADAVPSDTRESSWLSVFDALVLACIFAYLLLYFPPHLLLLDTMTVGGDTPAHNYLASHLREQLLHHGRIVSWAPGWWAGFPVFQYYFCLPYLLIAAFSLILPFNIAFKCISVLGIFILPGTAYAFGRCLRLPRPAPILMAIAMLPGLFVRSHTMWGVNVHSTLAGMLANSLSFPIMLLTIGSIYRDALDQRARLRSTLLAALLLSSHFFTSIMAAVTLTILPLLLPRGSRVPAMRAMLPTAIRAALLMAWWLIPLMATRGYSVDFGTNWNVLLANTMPPYALGLFPLVLLAVGWGLRTRNSGVALTAWMLVSAGVLFRWGFALTPVFVNVRLWPFFFEALLLLAAVGLAAAIRRTRAAWLMVAAVLTAVMLAIGTQELRPANGVSPIRDWAEFNYQGLEHRPGYSAFRELILPLDGTPGRLANDLAEENNAMGSSRILEAVPHLIRKAVLEGGLVNSGLSSYFAYYTQCESSENCAGYPTLVNPTTFNLANATRHFELLNVKHFLARWPTVQAALRASPAWNQIGQSSDWQLFELLTHDGSTVTIPAYWPVPVTTDHWKENALEWFYTPEWIDHPIVFQAPGDTTPLPGAGAPVPEAVFRQMLRKARGPTASIDEWLHLGPFPYPHDLADPLTFAPIAEAQADPHPGDVALNRDWHVLFSSSPIFPGRFYDQTEYLVSYSFVNIYCPTERDAILFYSNDDGVVMWLNGDEVVRDGITGLQEFHTQQIHLHAGRNRLLLKSQQSVGGQFFHVRLTDTAALPFVDVTTTAESKQPTPAPASLGRSIDRNGLGVRYERVDSQRIRFHTDAIGLPHLIKCSYFPNWKVKGAHRVYRVTPAFMLVYPEQSEVELYFGRTTADYIGLALTALGWLSVWLNFRTRGQDR